MKLEGGKLVDESFGMLAWKKRAEAATKEVGMERKNVVQKEGRQLAR